MKVVRYFHVRPFLNIRGGFCVRVSGDTDNPSHVAVQSAKCSRKDAYVKATGRAEAEKAPIKIVPLRFLPKELGSFLNDGTDFTFSIKYFLPKD